MRLHLAPQAADVDVYQVVVVGGVTPDGIEDLVRADDAAALIEKEVQEAEFGGGQIEGTPAREAMPAPRSTTRSPVCTVAGRRPRRRRTAPTRDTSSGTSNGLTT